MAIPDPVINFRAPSSLKIRLGLMAKRRRTKPGILLREWFIEWLIKEECLELLKRVGSEELLKRMTKPTYSTHQEKTTKDHDGFLVQTS